MKITERWQKLNRLYFYSSGIYPELVFQDDCAGLRQFIQQDSHGVVPDNPTPYYLRLKNGKEWYNWTRTETEKAFRGVSDSGVELFKWSGLRQLWEDWKGERWALREFLSWYPAKLPDSFFEEGDRFPRRDVDNAISAKIGEPLMGNDWPQYEDDWDDFFPTNEMVESLNRERQRMAVTKLEQQIRQIAGVMR